MLKNPGIPVSQKSRRLHDNVISIHNSLMDLIVQGMVENAECV